MEAYRAKYDFYLKKFESYLEDYMASLGNSPLRLIEAMNYSVSAGGKRVRPVLLLSVCDMLGGGTEEALPFAAAVELVHTYSLIHDDLPAMDNDDYRRGKLTNHKVYGEAMAILAGDALLNLAFEILFKEAVKGEKFARCGEILAVNAGYTGMIGGQAADLLYEKKTEPTIEDLNYIHKNKTSKLITAPILMGGCLAGGKKENVLQAFGEKLGLLFQYTDDILDVVGSFELLGKSIGKDAKEEKLTAVNFLGLERAKERVAELCEECVDLLSQIDADTAFLKNMTVNMVSRVK